ncbi:uncharacterized protein A1O9_12863 [Exophiala aquamarina CBS 119918]|uniref:Uncharacterized protein n=1 Tax=Exophiala aquamarina CBS 119918 TaxID=1182545 RepID=A0A072NTU2_9EURO|nr:uncharacterized protein A1O9_12863 [Exophiala aquamarina CBS 119918]KEF51081.1 hypothetical protein A1O9_12863 [Exophiala aquamarina CBS 119918]
MIFAPGVGFSYPPVKVSWTKREAILFALSIGATQDELNLLYELHPDFTLFPTYPSVLQFKGGATDVVDFYAAQDSAVIPGIPKLDPTRALDGERRLEVLCPLPTTSQGQDFMWHSKVIGVYDKGEKGTVLQHEYLLVEAGTGKAYSRLVGSGFFVGQGQWGGPKGLRAQLFPPPPGRESRPDAVYETRVGSTSAHLYRLNGDYNPLHATPEPGEAIGLGGIIMHGLYTWNSVAHLLVQKLAGSDPSTLKEYGARMSAPVKPGMMLLTEVWRSGNFTNGWEDIRFRTSAGGVEVLSNGRALIKCTSTIAKL